MYANSRPCVKRIALVFTLNSAQLRSAPYSSAKRIRNVMSSLVVLSFDVMGNSQSASQFVGALVISTVYGFDWFVRWAMIVNEAF